jgi:hypothetical protein
MNHRPFVFGLASAGVGVLAGAAYRTLIEASGHCSGLFGVTNPSAPCSNSESWVAFLNVFALVTLVGSLTSGVLLGMHIRDTDDGFVGLGDTFMAIGSIISLVEVVVFVTFGGYLGIVYGVLAVALTLFALKQERQVSLAVSAVMAVFALTWVMSDPGAAALGASPAVLWAFAAGAYIASLKTGEELGDAVTA